MNTLIEITRDRMTNAIARAKKVHPKVRTLGDRLYEVQGSTGQWYAVSFVLVNGKKLASCGCEAHRRGIPCYHISAALALHMGIVRMKQQEGH